MAKIVHLQQRAPTVWSKDRWRWIGSVMAAPGLNATAKLVAVALAQGFANHETAECRPGLPALMAAINAPKRTVMQALADLKAAGWIAAQGGNAPGKVAGYVFRWPVQVHQIAHEQVQSSAPYSSEHVQSAAHEQVQDPARTGAGSCSPPIPPYKDKPNMNHKGRSKSTASAMPQQVREKTGPTFFVEASNQLAVAEWNAWLTEHHMPNLSDLGCLRNCHELEGWWLPSRFPPSPHVSQEWAIFYLERAVGASSRQIKGGSA